MRKSEIKIYILELLLIVILFFAFFTKNIITRNILSIFLFIYMIIVCSFLKKRNVFSMYKKQVIFMMIIFSLLYLGLFYFLGLFSGFKKAKIFLSIKTLTTIIFPLIIIIVSSEVIRKVFLAQKIRFKKINLSLIFTFISMFLIDLVIYINIYDLSSLNDIKLIRMAADINSKMLVDSGINMCFGPVLDIYDGSSSNVLYNRCFSSDIIPWVM